MLAGAEFVIEIVVVAAAVVVEKYANVVDFVERSLNNCDCLYLSSVVFHIHLNHFPNYLLPDYPVDIA